MKDRGKVNGVTSGLTASDLAAVQQLVQLTACSGEEDANRRSDHDSIKIEEERVMMMILRKRSMGQVSRGDDGGEVLSMPRKRRFRPLADIYAETEPVVGAKDRGR